MSMRARSIVAIVVGATVLLILGGVLAVVMGGGERRVGAFDSRSYASGRTALFVEQTGSPHYRYLGYLGSFTGCEPRGNVTTGNPQQSGFTKHISSMSMEPCELEFGVAGMQQPLYDWISDTLAGTATPKDLWLVELGATGSQPRDVVHVAGAELAKIVFPELAASSTKPTALISATLRATSSEHPYPCCGAFSGSAGSATQQKVPGGTYFRFELGSLPSTRVRSVSSLEVTQDATGDVQFGNLDVEVAVVDTGQWANWFEDFAVDGHDTPSTRKSGRIAIKNVQGADVAVIELFDAGVFRRGPSNPGADASSLPTDVYSIFIERATFSIPQAAATGTTTSSQSTSTQTTTAQTTTAQTTTAQTTTGTTTTIQPPPQPPPGGGTIGAPEGLEGRAGENQAVLTWRPVEGATGYVILMSLNPREEFSQVGEAGGEEKEPSYTAEKLESGQTYYFVVRASSGDEQSADSKVVQIDVK
jgi:hypothetical protein